MHCVLATLLALSLSMPAKADIITPSITPMRGPKVLSVVKPKYPAYALQNLIQGRVVVRLALDQKGIPRDAMIVRSSSQCLNNAALEAAMAMTFTPAHSLLCPVPSIIDIPFVFKIR